MKTLSRGKTEPQIKQTRDSFLIKLFTAGNQSWKPGSAVWKSSSEPKFWSSILKGTTEITGQSSLGGNLIPSELTCHIYPIIIEM